MIGAALAIGAVAGGIGLIQGDRQRKSQEAAAAYNSTYQRLMIDHQNKMTDKIFDIKLSQAKQQTRWNREAANVAWGAEYDKFNELLRAERFRQTAAESQLQQAIGYTQALDSTVGNHSFNRASMINSLGSYGRSQALLAEAAFSRASQHGRRKDAIKHKLWQENYNVRERVSIPTLHNLQPPKAYIPKYGFGDALLDVGSAAVGAIQTGMALSPQGTTLFQDPNNPGPSLFKFGNPFG
tara:strand:+ start:74 stop:790 length:717 start_codon:yes stop_codon:yes gene_type:complete